MNDIQIKRLESQIISSSQKIFQTKGIKVLRKSFKKLKMPMKKLSFQNMH